MKKCLNIFILIFCCICLCGCANIEYQRVTDDTGQIMDKFTIELDRKKITATVGQSRYEELKKDIKNDIDAYVSVIQNRISNLQREMGGRMDFQNGVSVAGGTWGQETASTDKIFVRVNYLNSEYYRYINNITEDGEDDGGEIVSNWFVSKYIITTSNAFANLEEYEGSHNFYDYYTAKYGEFTMDDVALTQIYGTTDERLKSNADYVENIKGITYHLWEIDSENSAYKTCELQYYYLTAVGTGWYVVALACSVGLVLILLTIHIVKKIRSKKYRTQVVKFSDQVTVDDE